MPGARDCTTQFFFFLLQLKEVTRYSGLEGATLSLKGSGDGRGLMKLWNTQIGTFPWLLLCKWEWRWAGSGGIVEYSDWYVPMVTTMQRGWRWAGSDEVVEYSDWYVTMVTSM